jgi:cytochrome c553
MRYWAIAALLLAACQQQPKPLAKPAEISFDGAEVTDAAAKIAHGERLTHVLGCRGCHKADLTGSNFTADEPQYGPVYASNLTLVLPNYSDAQLERLLRTGVHPTRGNLWIMPSQLFQHLSDDDMKALIAHLRTLRGKGSPTPPPVISPKDREEIASGLYKPAAQLVRELKLVGPVDLGPDHALGRYITSVTCAECHGARLEGNEHFTPHTPDLIVASGYSRAEFEALMTRGVAKGGRKISPIMSGVARTRFSHLTPHERDELYAYLKARAEQP